MSEIYLIFLTRCFEVSVVLSYFFLSAEKQKKLLTLVYLSGKIILWIWKTLVVRISGSQITHTHVCVCFWIFINIQLIVTWPDGVVKFRVYFSGLLESQKVIFFISPLKFKVFSQCKNL